MKTFREYINEGSKLKAKFVDFYDKNGDTGEDTIWYFVNKEMADEFEDASIDDVIDAITDKEIKLFFSKYSKGINEDVAYDNNDMKKAIKLMSQIENKVKGEDDFNDFVKSLEKSSMDDIMIDAAANFFGNRSENIKKAIETALQKNYDKNGTEQGPALDLLVSVLKKI